MNPCIRTVGVLVGIALASSLAAQDAGKAVVDRGALAVRGKPAMNPALWSAATYDNLWKQWGLKERPADFPRGRTALRPAPRPVRERRLADGPALFQGPPRQGRHQ